MVSSPRICVSSEREEILIRLDQLKAIEYCAKAITERLTQLREIECGALKRKINRKCASSSY